MSAHIQERVALPRFRDPVLVMAFATPAKGGATANFALANLIGQWDASHIADIEAEGCYNFGRLRPPASHDGDGRTEIQWPENKIFCVDVRGSERTLLLLAGLEPTLNWQSFTTAVTQFALRAGVRTAISLRAVPAAVTHRQQDELFAWYSSQALAESIGLPVLAQSEVQADIGLSITAALQKLGCETADVFALEPYYIPALPGAKTALALIDAFASFVKAGYDDSELLGLAGEQERAIETMMASSPDFRAGIEALENRPLAQLAGGNDQTRARESSVAQMDEPLRADQVLFEVEELLRRNR